MGFLDKAKDSLTKAVNEHGDKIEKGAEKLGQTINDKTGGKHADKIAKGREQLKKGLDSIDKDDKGDKGDSGGRPGGAPR